jgi:phosphatidylserine/phosphatidylglycerophosphate/cardiolipin synthase-like enzyme
MTVLTSALGPDAAGTMLMRLLHDARHSIDAAIYEVGPSYRWALVRAVERGVRVRVVLDAHVSDGNAATSRAVIAAGGECRVAGVGAEAAHGKLILVDDTVAVGTGNLIWRDAPRDAHLRFPPGARPLAGTREWWATAVGSRRLNRTGAEIFAAHWMAATAPPTGWSAAPQRMAPPIGMPQPQVAPLVCCIASRRLRLITGGSAVGEALGSMVARARRRVLVTVPYTRPGAPPVRELLSRMSAASARGVGCALLLGGPPDPREAALLAVLPFAVRHMDPLRSTSGHAKGMVADGAVLVSSANWSAAGLGGNWEAALHIGHAGAASYYAAAWRRDWDSGLPIQV